MSDVECPTMAWIVARGIPALTAILQNVCRNECIEYSTIGRLRCNSGSITFVLIPDASSSLVISVEIPHGLRR